MVSSSRLRPMPRMPPPLVLVVLDGWGLSTSPDHNAIALARTPAYRELVERYPHAALVASGEAVGLPAGQMGNSEVGHMNLGAGRVVYQDLTRIDLGIRDGTFFDNPVLAAALDRCAGDRQALHLVGLVSDGGVHSHQRHLDALIAMAARRGVVRVFVHLVTDGRDTPPTGGAQYLAALERMLSAAGAGRVATGVRALLRHGPRPPLGPHAAGLRRPDWRRRANSPRGADADRRLVRRGRDR